MRAIWLVLLLLPGCTWFEDGELRTLLASCDLPADLQEPEHEGGDWYVARIHLAAQGPFDVEIPVPTWSGIDAQAWADASGGELRYEDNGTWLQVDGEDQVSFCLVGSAASDCCAEQYLDAQWSSQQAFNHGDAPVQMTYTALSRYCGADAERMLTPGASQERHFGGGWCS